MNLRQPPRIVKKSALGNVPRGSDPGVQRFLEELRNELIRVSGIAVDAMTALRDLQARQHARGAVEDGGASGGQGPALIPAALPPVTGVAVNATGDVVQIQCSAAIGGQVEVWRSNGEDSAGTAMQFVSRGPAAATFHDRPARSGDFLYWMRRVSDTNPLALGPMSPVGGESVSVQSSLSNVEGIGTVPGAGSVPADAVTGFLYLPSCDGPPTGAPDIPQGVLSGIPVVIDRTGHKLYFFSGGVWRDAGP